MRPTLPRSLLPRNRREGTTSRDSPSDRSFADAGRADWRLMRALLDYRSEFPILEETTYLINHSLGAMPRRAEDGLAEYARTWRERGIRAWGEGWWELPLTVGDQIGRIVGAPAGTTVMHQNVAVAEAVVLSCFRPTPQRNRVVYERGNFPSVRYLYQAQPELDVVVCEDDDEIVDAIDERTLLVPVSHVLFKSGEIQDVARIVERAHEAGAHVILDAYQSAGIVPLDLTALNVDFAVGGSVKWLCGGPGNGWLYVRPDLAALEPGYTGWQAHESPFAFEEEMRYAAGAARFLTGTPNVPALYAATAGYDLIEEIGVERIRANSLRQTDLLIGLADAAGFGIASPRDPDRRGGTVTVHVDEFAAVHKELSERQILCDFRPGAGIRIGPHYYSSDDELCHVIAQIGEIVETGAFERHVGAVARH
jgi:kynureninase